MSSGSERRLAAIVAADVVGFSRMMVQDEASTIGAMRAVERDILEPVVAARGGRIVKTMGDGFLIEFASAVAAVEAAAIVQGRLASAASDGPRVEMRIGIHVGDIVFDADDIFGEGVNIAARIEPLARPGGVSISDDTYRQVRGRGALQWQDGGTHEVKNIAQPIRIWHLQAPGAEHAPEQVADIPLPLPDKPSIAVLPFDNMSGDPEQEHFADGMTEDLITDLSKISGLFVVARNSTFVFKRKSVDIPSVARKLGVRHVLEGSIRKRGDKVRINVQLIDGQTGGHLWAERFDGPLAEVFELQDDVCAMVVEALKVRLSGDEAFRVAEIHTRNIEAYEVFVQAKATPYPPIPERINAARQLFEKVVELDPDFAGGHAGIAWMIGFAALTGHGDARAMGERAEELARRAIEVDENFGLSHMVLGLARLVQRDYEGALAATDRALALLPNDADAHLFSGIANAFTGHVDAGLVSVAQAFRLNAHFINAPYLNISAFFQFIKGDYAGAVATHERNIARGGPVGPPALAWSASAYQLLDDAGGQKRMLDMLAERWPAFRLEGWNLIGLMKNPAERDRLLGLMIEAGVPV
ncbi:adenylate/guanylate cyclase domain-containing protein [Ruegeria marina]|uniref:TolB amino-terminal domain-containing protein n=1 Tax=Ruegeria marina TaxID=639004 RepID=A0A1G6VGG2_9RHOB|nr:adenylate/guanylate cyclase domain-containing protein [Ruegeria marina]SDD51926.1 TolB amino-terminal domain-containing protein [Ruegeria marina]